jgi:hypothetical protein
MAAVEEYRLQAQFNWSRTQYLQVFNAAVLTAASALIEHPAVGAALVFALGAVVSISSLFAIRTQHNYHRAARDRRRRVEDFVSPGRPWDWGCAESSWPAGRPPVRSSPRWTCAPSS